MIPVSKTVPLVRNATLLATLVTVLVGFAPLYPAEFVIIQIQQLVNLPQT